ncbi:hypothetical protein Q4Q49_04970 [Shewanella sp. SP1S1-7]|uniref:Cap15 family cyclic dinucleotide receptor domain-containing protein n=1 Tax=unclassified Shewanella TaxID=196818 RepID=UPI00288DC5E1|nr:MULTISPECIES: hypothetical protein [unclassified Shewanella]MDT3319579.1 hypothetical protein [Shewanella sp. SP1S2-4]MDT3334643.1 hypothetical protein [Shewanella sp. SP1S1-7]
MWKVLPKLGLIKALAFIFSILLLSVILCLLGGVDFLVTLRFDNLLEISTYSSGVSLLFVLIIWLLAKWGWKSVWYIPKLDGILNEKVCPNLNGKWTGCVVSSFKDEEGNSKTKTVEMVIKADFIGFEIKLKSTDNYQRSTVIQSEIYKDPRDGNFYVSYIFESVIDNPLPTDDSKFDGAAKLVVRFENNNIFLVGTYWTNRAWQRGENTAGTISLMLEN